MTLKAAESESYQPISRERGRKARGDAPTNITGVIESVSPSGEQRLMRRAARVDANQVEIVSALRKAGATVQHLHSIGLGCPDILVGFRGRNFVLEIKDGSLSPSKRALTAQERAWHAWWRGSVSTIHSVEDALNAILAKRRA